MLWKRGAYLALWIIALSEPGSITPLSLTSDPREARKDEPFSLICENQTELLAVKWKRNNEVIIETKSNDMHIGPINDTTSATISFNEVAHRIKANFTENQHNLTLTNITHVDNGSVWRCASGQDESNNITIMVVGNRTEELPLETTIGDSKPEYSSTNHPLTVSEAKQDNLIYIIAGTISGIAVIIITIIIIAVVFTRKKKQQKECPGTSTDKVQSRQHVITNSDEEKDDSVFSDNILYGGYRGYSSELEQEQNVDKTIILPEETEITDVYAKVQKKKTNDVQMKVIEDGRLVCKQ